MSTIHLSPAAVPTIRRVNRDGSDFCDDPSVAERTFDSCGSYYAMLTKGPLANGHALVCTREHVLSVLQSFANAPDRRREFQMFVARVAGRLSTAFGASVIMFEHGAGAPCSPLGCGTDHAHLHLVPTPVSLRASLLRDQFVWKSSAAIWELPEGASTGDGYLYYADGLGALFSSPDGAPPSQYLRRVLANETGQPDLWDWRRQHGLDGVHAALKRLRSSSR